MVSRRLKLYPIIKFGSLPNSGSIVGLTQKNWKESNVMAVVVAVVVLMVVVVAVVVVIVWEVVGTVLVVVALV